tara:strand:+ start:408 stop:779 length:372 start_codon:yes stop_codon:yes gene_type:complete
MRYFITLLALALIGGFVTGKSLFAQEMTEEDWASKPVVCGTVEKITAIAERKGLELTWAGNGFANSVNMEEPMNVYVFLGINPKTKEWALTEISDGNEGCIIGYGGGFTIDSNTLKKLAKPTT